MKQPNSTLAPPCGGFFRKLTESKSHLLMLDYDGTLAPFTAVRSKAVPYTGVRKLLHDILSEGQTRMVIVSGRSLDDLVSLLDLDLMPEIWASHGWERRTVEGSNFLYPVPEMAKEGLSIALQRAEDAGLGKHSEAKPSSVALHWRGLPPQTLEMFKEWDWAAWQSLTKTYGLELHSFDGGMELRVPGYNKGTAVRTVLSESPCDVVAAYLGDDCTDEDAFAALPTDALSVLVRQELRSTVAMSWIRPPKGLLEFLYRWKSAVARPNG